ncbi:MAG: hypothetical protein FJW20_24760 [Acidimicrobiia bacterium]|nr:hypothetical protein [Acidimicrobiia bacterium]
MSEWNELLERFRRGPELLAVATTGASNPELDFVPAPDAWSARQIACHLADSEVVGSDRFRRTIAENNPTLMGYNEKLWAENLDYARSRISHVLEKFRLIRGDSYELLKSLPEDAFSRVCTHSERGAMTLLDLLRIYAEHAENHSRQIMSVREKYKEARAAAG